MRGTVKPHFAATRPVKGAGGQLDFGEFKKTRGDNTSFERRPNDGSIIAPKPISPYRSIMR